MIIARKLFRFTGENLLKVAEDQKKKQLEFFEAAKKFQTRIGGVRGEDIYTSSLPGGGQKLAGVIFKNEPFKGLWKEVEVTNSVKIYAPKRSTKEGKVIAEEMGALRWDTKELQKACGWSDMFDHEDMKMYAFNFFTNNKEVHGICVPIFKTYKKNEKPYKPVEGMTEISWEEYNAFNKDGI